MHEYEIKTNNNIVKILNLLNNYEYNRCLIHFLVLLYTD